MYKKIAIFCCLLSVCTMMCGCSNVTDSDITFDQSSAVSSDDSVFDDVSDSESNNTHTADKDESTVKQQEFVWNLRDIKLPDTDVIQSLPFEEGQNEELINKIMEYKAITDHYKAMSVKRQYGDSYKYSIFGFLSDEEAHESLGISSYHVLNGMGAEMKIEFSYGPQKIGRPESIKLDFTDNIPSQEEIHTLVADMIGKENADYLIYSQDVGDNLADSYKEIDIDGSVYAFERHVSSDRVILIFGVEPKFDREQMADENISLDIPYVGIDKVVNIDVGETDPNKNTFCDKLLEKYFSNYTDEKDYLSVDRNLYDCINVTYGDIKLSRVEAVVRYGDSTNNWSERLKLDYSAWMDKDGNVTLGSIEGDLTVANQSDYTSEIQQNLYDDAVKKAKDLLLATDVDAYSTDDYTSEKYYIKFDTDMETSDYIQFETYSNNAIKCFLHIHHWPDRSSS